MRLLCSPDQNKFISNSSPSGVSGYLNTGCRCMVCKISTFGRYASPPSMPGYKVPITSTVSCVSGPAVVYHLVCRSGRPECRKAHYVGMASTSKSNVKPMSSRWSNHKAHHKAGKNTCQMAEHLLTFHKNEDAQKFVTITILEACPDPVVAKERETIWTFNLFAFYPTGLNRREEVQFDQWKSIKLNFRKQWSVKYLLQKSEIYQLLYNINFLSPQQTIREATRI